MAEQGEVTDIRQMDDTALFAERRALRDQLAGMSNGGPDRAELKRRYDRLSCELDARASASWNSRPYELRVP